MMECDKLTIAVTIFLDHLVELRKKNNNNNNKRRTARIEALLGKLLIHLYVVTNIHIQIQRKFTEPKCE